MNGRTLFWWWLIVICLYQLPASLVDPNCIQVFGVIGGAFLTMFVFLKWIFNTLLRRHPFYIWTDRNRGADPLDRKHSKCLKIKVGINEKIRFIVTLRDKRTFERIHIKFSRIAWKQMLRSDLTTFFSYKSEDLGPETIEIISLKDTKNVALETKHSGKGINGDYSKLTSYLKDSEYEYEIEIKANKKFNGRLYFIQLLGDMEPGIASLRVIAERDGATKS